jgi:hypothetical protein
MSECQNHCANPSCTARLNRYAFSPNNRTTALYCRASCYAAFRREERWTRRIASIFSVRELDRDLFPEDR